jgi:hypothetical protein
MDSDFFVILALLRSDGFCFEYTTKPCWHISTKCVLLHDFLTMIKNEVLKYRNFLVFSEYKCFSYEEKDYSIKYEIHFVIQQNAPLCGSTACFSNRESFFSLVGLERELSWQERSDQAGLWRAGGATHPREHP